MAIMKKRKRSSRLIAQLQQFNAIILAPKLACCWKGTVPTLQGTSGKQRGGCFKKLAALCPHKDICEDGFCLLDSTHEEFCMDCTKCYLCVFRFPGRYSQRLYDLTLKCVRVVKVTATVGVLALGSSMPRWHAHCFQQKEAW